MRPVFELHDKDAGRYFRHLEDFLGKDAIEKRIGQIQRELNIEKGIYNHYWVVPKSKWWIGLKDGLSHILAGKSFRGKLTPLMRIPLKTAVKLSHLYSSMHDSKRQEYRSRILSDDMTCPPFLDQLDEGIFS